MNYIFQILNTVPHFVSLGVGQIAQEEVQAEEEVNKVVVQQERRKELRGKPYTMEKEQIKQEMKAAVCAEIDQWMDEKDAFEDGYEFEERLLQRFHNIGKLLMQKSVGAVPDNRNKKNSVLVLGR